jgi:hypothetical protein
MSTIKEISSVMGTKTSSPDSTVPLSEFPIITSDSSRVARAIDIEKFPPSLLNTTSSSSKLLIIPVSLTSSMLNEDLEMERNNLVPIDGLGALNPLTTFKIMRATSSLGINISKNRFFDMFIPRLLVALIILNVVNGFRATSPSMGTKLFPAISKSSLSSFSDTNVIDDVKLTEIISNFEDEDVMCSSEGGKFSVPISLASLEESDVVMGNSDNGTAESGDDVLALITELFQMPETPLSMVHLCDRLDMSKKTSREFFLLSLKRKLVLASMLKTDRNKYLETVKVSQFVYVYMCKPNICIIKFI